MHSTGEFQGCISFHLYIAGSLHDGMIAIDTRYGLGWTERNGQADFTSYAVDHGWDSIMWSMFMFMENGTSQLAWQCFALCRIRASLDCFFLSIIMRHDQTGRLIVKFNLVLAHSNRASPRSLTCFRASSRTMRSRTQTQRAACVSNSKAYHKSQIRAFLRVHIGWYWRHHVLSLTRRVS